MLCKNCECERVSKRENGNSNEVVKDGNKEL